LLELIPQKLKRRKMRKGVMKKKKKKKVMTKRKRKKKIVKRKARPKKKLKNGLLRMMFLTLVLKIVSLLDSQVINT